MRMGKENANLISLGKRPKALADVQRKRRKSSQAADTATALHDDAYKQFEESEWSAFRRSLDALVAQLPAHAGWSAALDGAVDACRVAMASAQSSQHSRQLTDKHLASLLMRYGGTLGESDQRVLYLLHQLDCLPHVSYERLAPVVWADAAIVKYADFIKFGAQLHRPTSSELINALDPKLLWNTLIGCPLHISSDVDGEGWLLRTSRPDYYDVRFVLPNLADICTESRPLDCRLFVERNCLSLLFAATTLHDPQLRAHAYVGLSRFLAQLQSVGCTTETFPSKSIYVYLIKLVKNSLPESNWRLNNVMAHFLARVSKVLLHPEDSVFHVLSAFLLCKPQLQLDVVPEFYRLFESSNAERAAKERDWMLQLLVDALREAADFDVMQRSNVFKLLLTQFNLSVVPDSSKLLTLKCVKAACALAADEHAPLRQLCHMGLLAWLVSAFGPAVQSTGDQLTVSYLFDVSTTVCSTLSPLLSDGSGRLAGQADELRLHCRILLHLLHAHARQADNYIRNKWLAHVQQLTTAFAVR